jgi:N-acetylneuraminic acid mutarotase
MQYKFWILGLVLYALGFMFCLSLPVQAKQATDTLSTDFYGGTEDNVQVNQSIKGGLQLAPYSMLSNWTSSSGPTSALYLAGVLVYNGKLYITGGKGTADSTTGGTGTTVDNALEAMHFGNIQADGEIEKWDPEKLVNMPQPTYGHANLAFNGRLYIFGGRTANSNTLDSVYWGKILGHDGQIKAYYQPNTWTAVASLPMPLFRPAAVRFERWVYIIGGMNSTDISQSNIYYAPVEPDGMILPGAWQTTTAPLPIPLSGHNAVITNGRVYVIGGSTSGQPGDSQNQIFVGSINPGTGDIPAWTATTPLPEPLFDAASTVAGGKIWVCGGATSTTAKATNVVYFAGINQADGMIPTSSERDTWTRATDLPSPVKWHNFVSFNNHLLVVGGTNNSGVQKQIMTANLVDNKQNILSWLPTTPMFLSNYGGGERPNWTGHSSVLKVPLMDQSYSSSTSGNKPVVYVIGGGPNTFSAYASGTGDTTNPAAAYSTVYRSNVDSNGSLQNWASDTTNGVIPMASVLQTSTMAVNNQVYVIGGVNSANAYIFAGAASRSDTAFYGTTPTGWYQAHADAFYENIGAGSTTGNFEATSYIPIRDPNWIPANNNPVGSPIVCYQPLIRSASVSYNDYIYVLGGISRVNRLPVVSFPATGTSDPDVQNRVWYCIPNANGTINPEGGPGGWKTTTPLPVRMYDMTACVANKRIYVFGGRDSGMVSGATIGGGVNVYYPTGTPPIPSTPPLSSVYYAAINTDGTLGTWTATTPMLLNLAEHAAVFTSGRVYIIGGSSDATGGTLRNRVFYCMPNASTGQIPNAGFYGTWEFTTTSLEHPVAGHTAVTSNGYIYVLGGRYGEPHSSNTYMTSISDVAYQNFQTYAWEGTYERFIDLDKDQFVDTLDWQAMPNGEIFRLKCRTGMERGPWSDWSLEQTAGPILIQRAVRYLHYKVTLQTARNTPGSAVTPLVNEVDVNYFGSKRMEEDSFQVNHNRFDPQVEPLMITFKTRAESVSTVIIRIYNLEGEMIRRQDIELPPDTPLPATGFWQWDGTNENTEYVANGVYLVQYNCGDTHKTRKVVVFKR